jgi:glycine cleavage system H protein
MDFPERLKYTKDHEWLLVDGSTGTIGITDFAQSELGDIVFVEMPEIGAFLEQGKSFGTIEAVKAVSDLFAPVGGEILEVNALCKDHPEQINKDPYGQGWLVKIHISDVHQIDQLLDVDSYRQLTGK